MSANYKVRTYLERYGNSMKGSSHLSRLLQMLIQPLSLFHCFDKIDLGKPGISAGRIGDAGDYARIDQLLSYGSSVGVGFDDGESRIPPLFDCNGQFDD
jgi:hypothetical protein